MKREKKEKTKEKTKKEKKEKTKQGQEIRAAEGSRDNLSPSADKIEQNQVYAILDEVFLAGEIEETSKQVVLTRLEHLDKLE